MKKEDNLLTTDPEFAELFSHFAFEETAMACGLTDEQRMTAVLSVLIGCGGVDEFSHAMQSAYAQGFEPIQMREIVYEAEPYIGYGRLFPFFGAMNEVFVAKGVALPLQKEDTLAEGTALEAGVALQEKLIGPYMKDKIQRASDDSRDFDRWLAQDCFGSYYTRGGLDLKLRALAGFCFLYAQGGCDSQLRMHVRINLNAGNTKHDLLGALKIGLPYIGFPRTFNALNIVNSAVQTYEENHE